VIETRFCRTEVDGRILTITLDRQEVRNALSQDASWELGEVFDTLECDPNLWLGIITGAGDKAFCAGADLKGGVNRDRAPVPPSGFGGLTFRTNRLKPVIAAVNGQAMGGGFELALASDIVVAAETATFGLTEPRVGLAALGGGIQRLIGEIGSKRAMAMLLTAKKITAAQALDLGLVNEIVAPGDLLATARRWADEILRCSPNSLIATKAVANAYDGRSLADSIGDMFDLPEVRKLLTGPDAREGPTAFAEKRTPVWSNPE
jgi:enoyl-CoA hydratase/carnithine racemase